MKTFTVTLESLFPYFRNVTVEAETAEQACEQALETDWDDDECNLDGGGPPYVVAIGKGETPAEWVNGKPVTTPPKWTRGAMLQEEMADVIRASALFAAAEAVEKVFGAHAWDDYHAQDAIEKLREALAPFRVSA